MSRGLPSSIPILPVAVNLVRAGLRDRLPPDRMEALQADLLRRLVRHAYDTVPYYRETLDPTAVAGLTGAADLVALPTLDRGQFPVLGSRLLADGFTPANTREAVSSGTSGRPAVVYFSEGDMGYLRASHLWDLVAFGLRPTDRIGFFRVGSFRRHRLERLGLVGNVHINTSLDLDQQVDAFLAGRPTFLTGFPNSMAALVGELKRRGIRYRDVRGVAFGGEPITPAVRAEVLDYFGADGHEVYAAVETHTIARSCPRGALHLRSADVVVEVEHDDGSVSVAAGDGQILVTRLHAEAMPLLRYRVGDRVSIVPDDCPCTTFSTPVVRAISGRVADRLRLRDGRFRNCEFVGSVLLRIDGIRQFQLDQIEPGRVDIVVVPARSEAGLADRILRAMPASADFEFGVRLVDRIPAGPNGKIRMVRQPLA